MNNFTEYITPERAEELHNGVEGNEKLPLSFWQKQAKDDSICENCDEKVWRFGGCGLCFSCTTGEADASEDYELILEV